MGIRIGYIGNFLHSWCTEVHIARDLRALGHDVTELQEPSNQGHKDRFLGDVHSIARTKQLDLVLFTRTWGLPPEATKLWRELEDMGVVTASYHLDLYVGLQRQEGIATDPFWTTQHVFTPDGDPRSAQFFEEHGINHHFSSPAVVSDECVPGTWQDRYNYDVIFVGSEGYHVEWPWRPQLIAHLRERYGNRFRRFGGDCPEGPTRGQDLNDLYATAKVVVGDSLTLPGHTHYWSDRYFETVGRGGFLIAPWVEGIDDFMVDGLHLRYYHHREGFERLDAMIDYYLNHLGEARRIANDGQQWVAKHHTYKHRLAMALEAMGFEPAPQTTTGGWQGTGWSGPPTTPEQAKAMDVEWMFYDPYKKIEKLELGSGYSPTPGFTHLDINPDCPDVDIVGRAWPLNIADNTVGELRCVDVLEHLSYWDSEQILADWFRVLEPGGKIYIQVPDADTIMWWYTNKPEKLIERLPEGLPQTALVGAAWRLLGGHNDGVYAKDADDFRFNAHYAFFSVESLRHALQLAGFVDIDIVSNPHPNLMCYARKPQ